MPTQRGVYTISIAGVVMPLTDDSKYQCVREVPVERQLDGISPQFQGLDGLCQTDKDVSGSQGKHFTDITERPCYQLINWTL